jgi:hypothetical protein
MPAKWRVLARFWPRRARAIVEMLMPKANRALKLQGKRVVIVGLEAGWVEGPKEA